MAFRSVVWFSGALVAMSIGLYACSSASTAASPSDDIDGGSSVAPGAPGSGELPCDVQSILETHCQRCHAQTPQFGAPMPLVTAADLYAPARSDGSKHVYERVIEKIGDDGSPMPPSPNPRLSTEDRKTLEAWVAAGAPLDAKGCGGDGPTTDASVPPPLDCIDKLALAPASKYAMPKATQNDYICYGFDVPASAQARHAVELGPLVDNSKIVHHMILFQSPSAYAKTPTPCSPAGDLSWRMVYGWAPGAGSMKLPDDVGFALDSGGSSHYVVQVHYNNALALDGETDGSGFEVCTSTPRPKEADVMAFGTQNINIPPGASVTQKCGFTVPDFSPTVHFIAALPHMHGIGTSISTSVAPAAGGAAVDMGTVASFDFDSQAWVPVDATVGPGDVVTTTCSWKNTRATTVKFGERTEDEMCYSFSMYYPRIFAPQWNWLAPALAAQCN